jgi:trehalose 6-phosphate phosphatase
MTPLPRFDPDWALFFDFDGTLAEIADTPGRVQVEARLGPSLRRMFEALDGAVAIISGRPIAEIDAFLDPLVLPVAGLHGLERRTAAGSIVRAAAANGLLDEARLRLAAIAAANPGVWMEDKSLTLVVHYRAAPHAAEACRQAAEEAIRHARGQLHVLDGKMVFEIKPTGVDKGAAIAAYLSERPFAGRTAVFVGDDASDEDGFAIVNRMGGHTVRVGDGTGTAARERVPAVADVLGWLRRLSSQSVTGSASGGG